MRSAGEDEVAPHKKKASPVRPLQNAAPSDPSSSSDVDGNLIERLPHLLRDFDTVRGILERQKRVLALSAATVAILLGIILALQTPLYESTALLLVKFGRELIYQPEVGEGQAFTQRDKQAVLNSELAIIHSQPVMESVVREVGLPALYPGLAEREAALAGLGGSAEAEAQRDLLYVEAANRLALSLTAQALPEAHVLRISFRHPDPLVASNAVNAAVESFTEKHLDAFSEPELVRFLTARVEEYRARLADTERALREFETQHRAFALDDPQGILLQRRDDANRDLIDLEREISNLRRGELGEASSVSEARRELLSLELEQSRVKGKLRDDVTQRIGVVKRFIRERQSERTAEVELLEAKRGELRERIMLVDEDLSDLPRLSTQYREIRRERDANEEQYRTYSKRLRDARLSHEMDAEKLASINVIQQAFPAPAPVWPRGYLLSGAVVIIVALVSGLLCATICDAFALPLPSWLRSQGGAHGRR
jgi:uncharacterized protein involved in exopolysaccharide biosynthesis